MKQSRKQSAHAMLLILVGALSTGLTWLLGGEAVPVRSATESRGRCHDSLDGRASVVPDLDSDFFKTTVSSHKWWIVEHEGGVENTMDDRIDPEDLLLVEHTATCTSTHQGKHEMQFCDAEATADGIKLTIWGGLPAYASELTVTMGAKLDFRCSFHAAYPAPTNPLRWNVTKKILKLRGKDLMARRRIYGWLSVEFEEIDEVTKESQSYRIEGYIKPVNTSLAKACTTQSK